MFPLALGPLPARGEMAMKFCGQSLRVLVPALFTAWLGLAGETIVVPDDYPTIQEAIDAASDGAVVCLGEGEWQEDLVIRKSVTLRGLGIGKTRIKGREEGWWPVIEVRHTETIEVLIEEISIIDGNNGIWVAGSSRVRLSNVVIAGHRQNGLVIWENAEVELLTSTVELNRNNGVVIMDSAAVSIIDSTIQHNGGLGIEVRGSAQVKLSDTAISDNGDYGCSLQGQSESTITQCLVKSGVLGIAISETAYAVVTGTTIEGGEYGGLYLQDKSQTTIIGSKIVGDKSFYGVSILDFAEASISSSLIADQWLYGVVVQDSGRVSIANSYIERNTHGIILADSAYATLIGNQITQNRKYGVTLYEPPCFNVETLAAVSSAAK